jgi:hypothetical protein
MSSRIFHDLMVHGPRRIMVEGSWAPNAGNAIDATSVKGKGFSVVWTSTGLFTITFQDAFVDLESFTCTLQLAAGDDMIIQAGTWTAASKTMTVRVWNIAGAAVADVAADANNRIHFQAVFKDTGV